MELSTPTPDPTTPAAHEPPAVALTSKAVEMVKLTREQ